MVVSHPVTHNCKSILHCACRLKNQIPDLEKSLKMIYMLQKKQDATEDMETQFLLSDQVYMKAHIAPTNKVCLWLGVSPKFFNLTHAALIQMKLVNIFYEYVCL